MVPALVRVLQSTTWFTKLVISLVLYVIAELLAVLFASRFRALVLVGCSALIAWYIFHRRPIPEPVPEPAAAQIAPARCTFR